MKVTQKTIEELSSLSVFRPSSTVELFLKDLLGISSSALKKFSLPKNFLNKNLKRGDTLDLSLDLLNLGMINPEYTGPLMKILFEDHNLLVLDKASEVHCHPLSYLEQDNCLSFLRSIRDDQILEVNKKNYDRGLLYRLDYETSGVLIYLKKDELYQGMRTEFSKIAKEKIYHCVVRGHFNREGKHAHLFWSTGERGHKISCMPAQGSIHKKEAQKGELSVRLLKFNKDKNESLLEVTLYTGLRHQIRAQLANLGFPLLGDELYGGNKAERLCLHAQTYKIEWKDLSYEIKSPSPFEL